MEHLSEFGQSQLSLCSSKSCFSSRNRPQYCFRMLFQKTKAIYKNPVSYISALSDKKKVYYLPYKVEMGAGNLSQVL